jgi:hypothetical protein
MTRQADIRGQPGVTKDRLHIVVWDYVVLGSVNYNEMYADSYGAHIVADPGVRVVLHNRRRLLRSPGELVQLLRSRRRSVRLRW